MRNGQGLGQSVAGSGGGRLSRSGFPGCGGQPLDERIGPRLGRILHQVPGHLGRGRDDRVEEAAAAGQLEGAAEDAHHSRLGSLQSGGGQQ